MNPKINFILFSVAIAILTLFALFYDMILLLVFALFSIFILNILFALLNIPNKLYWPSALLILVLGSFLIIINIYDLFTIEPFLFSILAGLIVAFGTTNERERNFIFKENLELIKSEQYAEADENLNKLLEKYPDNRLVLLSKMGILSLNNSLNNDLSELLSVSNKILEKHPKDSYALNFKAHALIELGKYAEADLILSNILEKEKNNETARANKGEILLKQGSYTEAIEYYDKSLKILPDKRKSKFLGLNIFVTFPVEKEIAKIWINKGKAHQNLSEFSEALESFNQALILDPDSEEAQELKKEVSKNIWFPLMNWNYVLKDIIQFKKILIINN